MQLNREQRDQFDRDEYLFFPNLFSAEEARMLNRAAGEVYAMDREEVWQWHQDCGTRARDDEMPEPRANR